MASTDAPPMPSPPVRAPNSTTLLPGPAALASLMSSVRMHADAQRVDQRVARVAVVEDDLAADVRQAEAVAVAADAGDDAGQHAARCPARRAAPKRSESMTATGRAPIVRMSRTMPPTPVAAPWYGST